MIRIVKLTLLGVVVNIKEIVRYSSDLIRYRRAANYLSIEWWLAIYYLFLNPYRICSHYFKKNGMDAQPYGETPLATIEPILASLQLSEQDHFIDLGCGRAKLLFWMSTRYSCRLTGIELNPTFNRISSKIITRLQLPIELIESNIFDEDLSSATVIYLYGSAFEDEVIEQLAQRVGKLSKETQIITISYPLNEYCEEPLFETVQSFTTTFLWGKTTAYLQKPLGIC